MNEACPTIVLSIDLWEVFFILKQTRMEIDDDQDVRHPNGGGGYNTQVACAPCPSRLVVGRNCWVGGIVAHHLGDVGIWNATTLGLVENGRSHRHSCHVGLLVVPLNQGLGPTLRALGGVWFSLTSGCGPRTDGVAGSMPTTSKSGKIDDLLWLVRDNVTVSSVRGSRSS